MIIADLLKGLEIKGQEGSLDIDIKGVAYDSRSVKEGYVFVAREGFSVNGHDFVKDAVSRGAVALITEKPKAEKPTTERPKAEKSPKKDHNKAADNAADAKGSDKQPASNENRPATSTIND